MSISYVDPFSGAESKTCSVAAAYATKVQKAAGFRFSEAEWEQHQHFGTWGVIKGKFQTGDLPDLPFAEIKMGGQVLKVGQKNGKLTVYNTTLKKTGDITLDELGTYVDYAVSHPNIITDFKWLGQNTPDVGSVGLGSKSVGALTDEDAAALFVKVKDDIATAKGINIKGVNPALDKDVFEAIAKQTGYTPSELQAKVNAYKASGKKLSALKKKVKTGKAKTMDVNVPKPPAAPTAADLGSESALKTAVANAKSNEALLKDLGLDKPDTPAIPVGNPHVKLSDKHPQYGFRVVDDNDTLIGYVKKTESNVPVMGKTNYSVGHTKEVKWYAYDVNGKKIESIWPPKKSSDAAFKLMDYVKKNGLPNAVLKKVPVEAAQDVVKAAVSDLKASLPKYTDEEVSKAYIKAKDQIAADPNNPWTLYTQNSKEFEDAIVNTMEKFYDIHLEPDQIKQQVARYLGDGNKLSVLKKKMAKTGEYTPQADTLKGAGSKAAGSKTKAAKDIDEMAGIYNPTGWTEFKWEPGQEDFVFNNLKNNLFSSMNDQSAYQNFQTLYDNWQDYYPGKKKPDLLSLVRAYDKKKAAQLGITNGGFYEKKVVNFASSPTGQSVIKAKKVAAELEKNLPPLPADSSGFPILSPEQMGNLQRRIRPQWSPDEKSALVSYTGSGYSSINGQLRRGSVSVYEKKTINNMIKGMDPLPQDLLVHRGCSWEQFGLGSYENALASIGKTVTDEGFLSTSVGGHAAFGGSVKVIVELPKGTVGAFVKSISRFSNENEYIVAAGTKFKVLTVKKSGYQTEVRVRAIPGSHTKKV